MHNHHLTKDIGRLDLKLQYNLKNNSHVVFCDTYTHRSFEVFVMVNSVRLCLLLPNQQFTLPKKGFPTSIRSACMIKFKQSGNGLLISYRQFNSSKNASEWKMAMVKAIWYDLGSLDTIKGGNF